MSIHSKFYRPRPLSEDELHRICPSVFTATARPDRSDRFRPIATIETVRALADEDFHVYGAGQSSARYEDGVPFVRHLLKFRRGRDGAPRLLSVGDSTLEVVLTNANDGSRAYTLDAGIFKLACTNGLVVKSKDFGSVRVRHTGSHFDVAQKVVEGTHGIVAKANIALEAPERWSKIKVDTEVRQLFARIAHRMRFGLDSRISPHQLLIPRRPADMGSDLWTLLNVVQENIIEGGLSEIRRSGNRLHTTRGIGAIGTNLRLNRELWEMAETLSRGEELVLEPAAVAA